MSARPVLCPHVCLCPKGFMTPFSALAGFCLHTQIVFPSRTDHFPGHSQHKKNLVFPLLSYPSPQKCRTLHKVPQAHPSGCQSPAKKTCSGKHPAARNEMLLPIPLDHQERADFCRVTHSVIMKCYDTRSAKFYS